MADLDVYELNVDMTHAGQNCVNVHHFAQIGSDGTGTWQAALLAVWQDNFRTPLTDCMVTAVQIVQTRMRRLFVGQTQQTIVADGTNGDQLDTGLAPHIAYLLRLRASPDGRKGTGGVKICGVGQAAVANGRISVAQAALIQTYGEVFESQHTHVASGFVFAPGIVSPSDGAFRGVEKARVTPRLATVHSRQIGVGD